MEFQRGQREFIRHWPSLKITWDLGSCGETQPIWITSELPAWTCEDYHSYRTHQSSWNDLPALCLLCHQNNHGSLKAETTARLSYLPEPEDPHLRTNYTCSGKELVQPTWTKRREAAEEEGSEQNHFCWLKRHPAWGLPHQHIKGDGRTLWNTQWCVFPILLSGFIWKAAKSNIFHFLEIH